MRIFLVLLLVGFPLLIGCETTRTHRPVPYSNLDMRSTERLLERRQSLARIEASYDAHGGPPDRLTNRRELARLGDEQALDKIQELRAVEAELLRRYRAGESRAYFPGIEGMMESGAPSTGVR
jgi:hypothetical protein